jgi:hypothetical protein
MPLTTADFKQAYYRQLLPALVAIAAAAAVRSAGMAVAISQASAAKMVGVGLFAASIAAAVGLPIWIRTAFANRMRRSRGVGEADFARFQRHLIATALVAPYLAAAALALSLPSFYQAGSFLAALYAMYYHYPSEQRVGFDRRLFRVGSSDPC